MKTKKSVIDSLGTWDDGGDRYPRSEVEKAMDEWAMEQAILYAEFRTEYKREEQSRFLKAKKEGTYAKWLADSDSKIYAQFIEQQNHK